MDPNEAEELQRTFQVLLWDVAETGFEMNSRPFKPMLKRRMGSGRPPIFVNAEMQHSMKTFNDRFRNVNFTVYELGFHYSTKLFSKKSLKDRLVKSWVREVLSIFQSHSKELNEMAWRLMRGQTFHFETQTWEETSS